MHTPWTMAEELQKYGVQLPFVNQAQSLTNNSTRSGVDRYCHSPLCLKVQDIPYTVVLQP